MFRGDFLFTAVSGLIFLLLHGPLGSERSNVIASTTETSTPKSSCAVEKILGPVPSPSLTTCLKSGFRSLRARFLICQKKIVIFKHWAHFSPTNGVRANIYRVRTFTRVFLSVSKC